MLSPVSSSLCYSCVGGEQRYRLALLTSNWPAEPVSKYPIRSESPVHSLIQFDIRRRKVELVARKLGLDLMS